MAEAEGIERMAAAAAATTTTTTEFISKSPSSLPLRNRPGIDGRPSLSMPSWRSLTTPKPATLITKIHNKWYDLTEFERHHPGGPVALGLARGRDATVMFESHHPFTHRRVLNAILEKYLIDESDAKNMRTLEQQHGIEEHRFEWPSEFGEALKFQVKEYFEGEAKRRNVSLQEATKATPARWLEIAIMAVIYVSTFSGFIKGDWRCLILWPVAAWCVGVNTFHDATHFALTANWRINALLPYIYPFFSSPFVWYHQHNIGHHSYPNVADRDPDLLNHYWLKREAKTVKWLPVHNFQSQIWFLAIWWSVAVEFGLTTMQDFWMLETKKYNEVVPMMEVSGVRRVVHLAGRILTVVVIHAWPFLVLDSWIKCFAFCVIPYALFSILFMLNTQINHLLPHTAHATDPDWYKHQVITAQDFGVTSRFCFIFSGGLNYQVIHHLFPTVNHCHLPVLQPIVARLCEKYGVNYVHVAGYVAAVKAHHEHSVNMSKRPTH